MELESHPNAGSHVPEARFRRLLAQAIVIPVSVLALTAVVLAALVAYQQNATWWVEHTHRVIRNASILDAEHLGADAKYREFLLTRRTGAREEADAAAATFEARIEALGGLAGDNPRQTAKFRALQQRSRHWRDLWQEELAAAGTRPAATPPADVQRAGRIGEAAADLEALRRELSALIAEEEALRRSRVEHAWWATTGTLAGGTAVLLAAAVVLALWARGQLRDLATRYTSAVVAARSRAAEAERVSRALEALVAATPLPVIALDARARVTLWNPAAEQLLGWTREEVLGKRLPHVGPGQKASAEDIFARSMRGEHFVNVEIDRHTKDGRMLHLSFASAPLRTADGEIIGMIGISTDVTDRKRAEVELTEAKEAAEAANRAKDQFLAVLSHELRTPLTPVLTVLQLLEERSNLPPESRQDVTLARRNVEVEARLIDDLLDLTRVSRGKLQMRMATVDLHGAIRSALAVCREDLTAKALEIYVDLAAARHHVRGDAARLQQVFWNLVKNAVKFTPHHGRITVRSHNRAAAGEGPETVVVEVVDSGIGIPAEALPRIFDPFEQGEQSITRRFGGLGLGLAISKALIDSHGGTLTASSAGNDQGAVFSAEIPTTVPAPADDAPGRPAAVRAGSLRVLLLEDHEDTARVMARLLRTLGHTVQVTHSVASAVAAARAEEFDLIISDIGLPDGSGIDFIREARKSAATPGVAAIALSGFGMESDITRSREAGFDDHLTKPVNVHVLERAIEDVMSKTVAKR